MTADEILVGAKYVATVLGRPTTVQVENLYQLEPWCWSCVSSSGVHLVVPLTDFIAAEPSTDGVAQTTPPASAPPSMAPSPG